MRDKEKKHPAGTIRWINVEMKFRTTSRRYFNYISTLIQCQMPAGHISMNALTLIMADKV